MLFCFFFFPPHISSNFLRPPLCHLEAPTFKITGLRVRVMWSADLGLNSHVIKWRWMTRKRLKMPWELVWITPPFIEISLQKLFFPPLYLQEMNTRTSGCSSVKGVCLLAVRVSTMSSWKPTRQTTTELHSDLQHISDSAAECTHSSLR